jgi:TolA-binding protein
MNRRVVQTIGVITGLLLLFGLSQTAESPANAADNQKTEGSKGLSVDDLKRGLKNASQNVEKEIPKIGPAIGNAVKKITEKESDKSSSQDQSKQKK